MATIKAVSSKAGIKTVIDYVTKEEKTEEKLLSGKDCLAQTAYDEMQATKEIWNKTGGRTYKHFVQSFHKDENITPEKAHEIAKKFAERCKQFKDFEVLIATHKDRQHIHTHFILNSVSFMDGHKFQMHKDELQQMKDLSDSLCIEYGLTITEKGKTFEGAEREETSAYTKEAYQLLKKAERGEVKSYVQDIALAVLDCKGAATNKQEFIWMMGEKGYGVDWQDNHKYITFTDLARQKQGEKQCKIRNNKLEKYYNINFGKEELLNEFEINARSREAEQTAKRTINSARQQLADNRTTETVNSRTAEETRRSTGADTDALIRDISSERRNQRSSERQSAEERNDSISERTISSARQPAADKRGSETAALIGELNAAERAAIEKSESSAAQRKDRELARERLAAERSARAEAERRAAAEAKRAAEERSRTVRKSSRESGRSR